MNPFRFVIWRPFLLAIALLSLCLGFGSPLLFAGGPASPYSLPKVWAGEIIEADQGLVTLYSIMIDAAVKPRAGDFTFFLRGRKTKLTYAFTAKTQLAKLPPNVYWKIKEDTYDLIEASFVDDFGRKRYWKGIYPKSILVKPKSLSMMGLWYLVYLKTDSQFNILIKDYRLNLPIERWRGSVVSIIDGLSGAEWSRYTGPTHTTPQQIRRVVTGSRSINMVYRLDLFRMNSYAGEMSKVLEINDGDIRSCYTDLLDRKDGVQGSLTYSFVYSGIAQGIKSLKIRETTLNDEIFQECMFFKLRGLTFALTQSLAGELSFQFNTSE